MSILEVSSWRTDWTLAGKRMAAELFFGIIPSVAILSSEPANLAGSNGNENTFSMEQATRKASELSASGYISRYTS